MIAIYVLIGLVFIRDWIKIFKFKRIFFNSGKLLIKSYFNNDEIEISVIDVVSINNVVMKFTNNDSNAFYSLVFSYSDDEKTIFFYKSPWINGIDGIKDLIGLT